MRKLCLPVVVMQFFILMGCSGVGESDSPMKDGLYLKYEVSSPDITPYNHTMSFKKITGKKFQLTREDGFMRNKTVRNAYVTPDFLDFESPESRGHIPGPTGGFLWISPDDLKQNNIIQHKVLGETTKNSYDVYKLQYTPLGDISYYEKTTGFLVAHENIHSSTKVYSRLVATNADGLGGH